MRGATTYNEITCMLLQISIHAPHAGRDRPAGRLPYDHVISIHAPHAGRDGRPSSTTFFGRNFNPRAPCGARRRTRPRLSLDRTFQSTRPMRGATAGLHHLLIPWVISIHAPHAGRDCRLRHSAACCINFNPRAPCGARQRIRFGYPGRPLISIHAPHAGRDRPPMATTMTSPDFNPRAPCGARHQRIVANAEG